MANGSFKGITDLVEQQSVYKAEYEGLKEMQVKYDFIMNLLEKIFVDKQEITASTMVMIIESLENKKFEAKKEGIENE